MSADDSTAAHFPSVASLVDQIFQDISAAPDGKPQVTSEQLKSLALLCDKNWGKALQIVDRGGVRCFVAQRSARRVYQVQGKAAGDAYLVWPRHYCACHAFFYEVVGRGDAVYCKHQLAALAAEALRACAVTTVTDLQLAEIILSAH